MTEKKEVAKKEAAAGGEKVKSGKREDKKVSRWTMAECMKFAKRFQTEGEWAHGAPSSYKAAVARGFTNDCTKHMTSKPVKKKSA